MKIKINVIGFFLLIGVLSIVQACNTKANNSQTAQESCCSSEKKEIVENNSSCCNTEQEGEITAYYFHATHRCATCQAVEKVSKEYIEENYSEKVNFISLNREEEQNKDLVEKYQIGGQTLIIVFQDEVVNLTNDAFLNARSNPEKLEEIIKSTIDSHLN